MCIEICVLLSVGNEQHFSIIDGPHHSSIYLALNAGQAASTGLRVACPPATAPTLLSGHAEGTQIVLLLHVEASDPRGAQQGPAPPGSQRLEEEVVVHLGVVHVQVVFGYVVQGQGVRLHRWHCAIFGQLGDRKNMFGPNVYAKPIPSPKTREHRLFNRRAK